MLPTRSQFADVMTKLGIRPDDTLLLYDSFDNGIYFSPRAAWTCRYLGHNKAYVLDNFRKYVQQEYPVETGELLSQLTLSSAGAGASSVYEFDGSGQPPLSSSSSTDQKLVTFEELQSLITDKSQTGKFQIVDARAADVFHGSRDAASGQILSGGHMPSAINVPMASILDDADKALMSPAELKARFTEAGVKDHLLTVLTCNTGVTAAVLDLAIHTSGLQLDTRLYDGSWSEWSKRVEGDGLIVVD